MDWAPEHEIRTEQAARLIATQFPALAALPVVPLATGWDNSVFTVGDAWAFRFPRRETALPGIRREISLLPLLARRLPLPVPVPELLGVPAESFPWPFTGNRFVHGAELFSLRDDQRAPAAADLGSFLRALHDVRDRGRDLPVDPLRRTDPAARIARTQPHVEAIAHLWQPDEAVRALYEEACGLPPWSGEPVLVHGDLHLRHLLVAPDGAATGVIDWGDVCLADASVDLMLVYGGFTGTARDAFFDAYGPVTRAQELRARVLSVGVCAALAVSAPEASALQHEALRGLVRSVS
ncbi:MAG: phosphotransferase [Actinobacteria bacterium]|nr:phosphotransferase [Actinomycetota bacterium]